MPMLHSVFSFHFPTEIHAPPPWKQARSIWKFTLCAEFSQFALPVFENFTYGQKITAIRNFSPMPASLWETSCRLAATAVTAIHNLPVWDRGTLPFSPCLFTSSSFVFVFFLLFPLFHWLYVFSSFVHPFPFYQNSPTPFPGRRL